VELVVSLDPDRAGLRGTDDRDRRLADLRLPLERSARSRVGRRDRKIGLSVDSLRHVVTSPHFLVLMTAAPTLVDVDVNTHSLWPLPRPSAGDRHPSMGSQSTANKSRSKITPDQYSVRGQSLHPQALVLLGGTAVQSERADSGRQSRENVQRSHVDWAGPVCAYVPLSPVGPLTRVTQVTSAFDHARNISEAGRADDPLQSFRPAAVLRLLRTVRLRRPAIARKPAWTFELSLGARWSSRHQPQHFVSQQAAWPRPQIPSPSDRWTDLDLAIVIANQPVVDWLFPDSRWPAAR
jgi:hypothetical protein